MQATLRVLIVGAGLAGLALARALEPSGVTATVLERSSNAPQGAGILLTGNAIRALDQLGLGEAVRAMGRRVSRVDFRASNGDRLFRLDCPTDWPDFVSIHHARLRAILLDSLSGLEPRWNCSPETLTEEANGTRVTDSSGTSALYDLVVGADGVGSQVAGLAFGAPKPEPTPQLHGWRFIAACPPDLREPTYQIGNGLTLLLHPLAGGEVYCGAGPIHSEATRSIEGACDLTRLREAFRDFAGPARDVLDGIDASTTLIPTRYWHIERDRWGRGRTVLIGDAAHASAPTLAQGGAMAFEDALVLRDQLTRESSVETAIERFEERRRPRVGFVQREALSRIQTNLPMDDRRFEMRIQIAREAGLERLRNVWSELVTTAP